VVGASFPVVPKDRPGSGRRCPPPTRGRTWNGRCSPSRRRRRRRQPKR